MTGETLPDLSGRDALDVSSPSLPLRVPRPDPEAPRSQAATVNGFDGRGLNKGWAGFSDARLAQWRAEFAREPENARFRILVSGLDEELAHRAGLDAGVA